MAWSMLIPLISKAIDVVESRRGRKGKDKEDEAVEIVKEACTHDVDSSLEESIREAIKAAVKAENMARLAGPGTPETPHE